MSDLYIPFCSLLLNVFLIILYLFKMNQTKKENIFYFGMIIDTFFMTLFCILAIILMFAKPVAYTNIKIFNKVECIFIFNFFCNLAMYVIGVSKLQISKIKLFYWLLNTFVGIVLLFLPVTLKKTNDLTFLISGGLAINVLTVLSFILLLCIFLIALKNKSIINEKLIPINILLLFIIIIIFIRTYLPEVVCLEFLGTLVLLIMYHTIENPDIRIIKELNWTKDLVVRANNSKTAFLNNMSHEIRTPLNVIVGFSECIEKSSSLEEAKENAKDIVKASNNLLEIISSVLDFSSLETGKIKVENVEYNPVETIKNVVSIIKTKINEKNLEFKLYIAPDVPMFLYGDANNLKKILINLLMNSLAWTDTGYIEIKVHCIKRENVCRLILGIEDTGSGIRNSELNSFLKSDINNGENIESSGLTVVKKLLDLMDGNIIAQSMIGKGTKFTIAINQRIVEKVIASEETTIELDSNNYNFTDKKVLIVDDNKLNLKIATKLVSKYTSCIKCVESGYECLDLINNGEHFDLILMDDMMPEMSGVETFRKLKEIPEFRTPTVMLTANAISGMREKYLVIGFDEYISKPIDKKELDRVLRLFL